MGSYGTKNVVSVSGRQLNDNQTSYGTWNKLKQEIHGHNWVPMVTLKTVA